MFNLNSQLLLHFNSEW